MVTCSTNLCPQSHTGRGTRTKGELLVSYRLTSIPAMRDNYLSIRDFKIVKPELGPIRFIHNILVTYITEPAQISVKSKLCNSLNKHLNL